MTLLIELVPHSQHWAAAAARDAARVRRALAGSCLAVYHVGSTSVSGMASVPVIDLLAEMRDLAALHAARLRLLAHGFVEQPEVHGHPRTYHVEDIVTRRRQVELHCYAAGHPEAEQVVAIFAYLRAYPEAAQAYEALKREGRTRFAADPGAYARTKQAWVDGVLQAALAHWRTRSGDLPVRALP